MRLLRLLPFGLLAYTSALAQFVPEDSNIANTAEAIARERRNLLSAPNKSPATPPVFYPVPYWTRGILQPYSGAVSRPWLKFDATTQQLYSRSATDEPEPINMAVLKAFAVGDSLLGTRRVYRRYLNARLENATLRTAFFEVRYDSGRTVLLCRRVVTEKIAQRGGWTSRYEKATYFLKKGGDNLIAPLELNYKALLAALPPAHRPALAAYASKRALKLNRERDVIQLIAYYDTL